MKKILSILSLAVVFSSCASNGRSNENIKDRASKNAEIEEVSKVYEDSKNIKEIDEKDVESKKEDNEDKKRDPEHLKDEDVKIDKDNIFYIPHFYLVQFDQNGNLVDLDGNTKFENGSKFYEQVPSTEFFVGKATKDNEFGIYELVGKNLNILFRFGQKEEFKPIGMIGNKIYGYHYLIKLDEDNNISNMRNTIAYYDIENKELRDYTGKYSTGLSSAALTSDKIYFISYDDDKNTLYAFDSESDFRDDPKLVEEDFDSFDIYATSYKQGGEVVNDYFKSDVDGIHIGDEVWKLPENAEGYVQIRGRYIFYFTKPTEEKPSDYEQNLKIYDAYEGNLVFDENIRGQKYFQNTLYYIDENDEIEKFEISLS